MAVVHYDPILFSFLWALSVNLFLPTVVIVIESIGEISEREGTDAVHAHANLVDVMRLKSKPPLCGRIGLHLHGIR